MRMPRLVAISATALLLVAGTAACSSDDSGSTPKKSSSATSAPSADATDEKSTEPTEDTESSDDKSTEPTEDTSASSNGDFCTTAMDVFGNFDMSAMSSTDPAYVRDMAADFRSVGEAAEGDTQTTWLSFADYLDLSADLLEDPSDADKLSELTEQMGDLTTLSTELSNSVMECM